VSPAGIAESPGKLKVSGGLNLIVRNFQKKIPINKKRIKEVIFNALALEGSGISGEITICFVNDAKIKALNLKYLHKNKPTDVLAFDMGRPPDSRTILADIVISTDTAIRNAGIFKTSPLYELNLYALHGLLHLLGYSDSNPKQRQLMQRKEKKYANTENRGLSFKQT